MTEDQENKPFQDDQPVDNTPADDNNTYSSPEQDSGETEIPDSSEDNSGNTESDTPDISCSCSGSDCNNGGCTNEPEAKPNKKPVRKAGSKGALKPDKYRKHILCRYGKMGNLGYFAHDVEDFEEKASHVIVNTERGLEIAEIVSHETSHKKGNCTIKESQIIQYTKDSCDNFPLDRKGTVVRPATEQDVREQKHLDEGVAKELSYCESLIKQQNLEMTLVDAERLFGGERIIFYFMAEGRVDFRMLVKELAQQYQTRIEMRQVGARDEARLVADFETCGRQCCCKSFLKVLYPVNMRMAKLQKATLDPSKISGRCGRLKCCLRFEDEVYQEHKKKLPKKNSVVLTPEGPGKVIDSQVLTLLVKVYLDAGKMLAIPLDEILEFNYVAPAVPEVKAEDRSNRPRPKPRPRPVKKEQASADQPTGGNQQAEAPLVKPNNSADGTPAENGDDPEKKKKRRRRRRRKKKPTDGQNGGNDTGNDGGGNSTAE